MANLVDIAKYTGLAVSTVSKYFNGGSVRSYNRQKIEDALKVLHYEPNLIARSMKTRKTDTYGILLPNLQSTFDTTYVTALTNALSERGCGCILALYQGDEDKEGEMFNFLKRKQVDGIILFPYGMRQDLIRTFAQWEKPLVLIDDVVEDCSLSSVVLDNEETVYQIVSKLIEQGHRNIAILNGISYSSQERVAGYRRALREHGIQENPKYIKTDRWSIEKGVELTSDVLDGTPEVTAMITCSEEYGLGAFQEISRRGLSPDTDLTTVSFDLYGISAIVNPSLHAVKQPIADMAERAVQILLGEGEFEKVNRFMPDMSDLMNSLTGKR